MIFLLLFILPMAVALADPSTGGADPGRPRRPLGSLPRLGGWACPCGGPAFFPRRACAGHGPGPFSGLAAVGLAVAAPDSQGREVRE